MGKLVVVLVAKKKTLELNDELDQKFRKRIVQVKGLLRSVIQKAIIGEDINIWLHQPEEESKRNILEKKNLTKRE